MTGLRSAILTLLLWPLLAGPAPAAEGDDDPTNVERLLAELKGIPSRHEQMPEQGRILLEASHCRRTDALVRELKRITDESDIHQSVRFYAMYALWVMGEDKEFFLARARSEDLELARYAVEVLAYSPDRATMDALEEIKARTPGEVTTLHGAISMARHVWGCSTSYRHISSVRDKVVFLLFRMPGAATHGINGGRVDEGSRLGVLYQPVVWSSRQLLVLSEAEPDGVADALSEIPLDEGRLTYARRFLSRRTLQLLAERAPSAASVSPEESSEFLSKEATAHIKRYGKYLSSETKGGGSRGSRWPLMAAIGAVVLLGFALAALIFRRRRA